MDTSMQCEYCGLEFFNATELNKHMGQEHASLEAQKMRYPCKRCGEVLPSPKAYAEHMKVAHPEVVQRINMIYWAVTIIVVLLALWRFLT